MSQSMPVEIVWEFVCEHFGSATNALSNARKYWYIPSKKTRVKIWFKYVNAQIIIPTNSRSMSKLLNY